jgi:hypothetical protein
MNRQKEILYKNAKEFKSWLKDAEKKKGGAGNVNT